MRPLRSLQSPVHGGPSNTVSASFPRPKRINAADSRTFLSPWESLRFSDSKRTKTALAATWNASPRSALNFTRWASTQLRPSISSSPSKGRAWIQSWPQDGDATLKASFQAEGTPRARGFPVMQLRFRIGEKLRRPGSRARCHHSVANVAPMRWRAANTSSHVESMCIGLPAHTRIDSGPRSVGGRVS
jgi:hypothetical protein